MVVFPWLPIAAFLEAHARIADRIEVRTLVEGSTVVMQAINTNIEKNLKKAMAGSRQIDRNPY